MEIRNVWKNYKPKDVRACQAFAGEYRQFISSAKTEREFIDGIIPLIEANGYRELEAVRESGEVLKKGDRVYSVKMNKSIVMLEIGEKPLTEGMNILGAHIDSPRLDIKQKPLYEDGGFALLDTHYYGGIKNYQWVTIPLALHGVVVKKDGTTVELSVGEDPDDPVFFVSDLLIHLAREQMEKKASSVIEGEALDIIVGNEPFVIRGRKEKDKKESDVKEAIKAGILDILKNTYGFEEDDFLSAELEVVPAGPARDAGFDRSMILGYGHDDRSCAYPSVRAMLDLKDPERTACCILVDKEEIGSVGATGMQSHFFENVIAEVMALCGDESSLHLRRTLENSCMLSSDVSAAYDPSYASRFDTKNSAFMGGGMSILKFTGGRGKSGSNDANAEYMAAVRAIFDRAGVCFQTTEIGAVDQGGGGTIAFILALYGMKVIDCGVPVLNMHAPWEAISKADLYETYRGYAAFLKDMGTEREYDR